MTQTLPINMDMLRNKIVQGITEIHNSINDREAVLFVGDTGVGKSTLLSYLIGEQLRIQQVGLKACLVNRSQNNQTSVKIGHNKYSETSVPVRVDYQGLALYDCPGFNDNKSQQAQIANSFYYQRLMSLYQKIKLVIIVDESYITETRAHSLPSLAKKLQEAFGSLETVRYSTLLIINKCDPDSTLDDVKRQLRKLITTKDMFTLDQVQYFEYLMSNQQIYSFKHPKRSQIGQYASQDDREKILRKINELHYMDQVDIKNIISDVAKLAIRDYLDVVTEQSAKNLNQLMERIKNAVLITKTNLYQIKQQIVQLFRYKDRMVQRRDLTPLFDFCIQRKVQCEEINNLKQELEIVEFFSKVYSKQKTEGYYLNAVSCILTNFSVMLQKIDAMIQNEKLEAERKRREQQKKLQQQGLKALEQSKENIIQSTINEVAQGLQMKILEQSLKINQYKLKNVKLLQPTCDEPTLLAFHRKLINAQLKVKQISYAITEFHTRASAFTHTLDRLQTLQN